MIPYPDIFLYVHSFIAILGMLLNALLIYLAIFQTPKVIRSYALLILNFAVTDFFACFFDLFVQQRIIPAGRTLAYISNGFCKHYSPSTCYLGYSLMLHFLSHSLWSLLLSFSYRYYVLLRPAPARYTLFTIILLVYIPSAFQWVSFLWAQDAPSEIAKILHVKFPDYDLDGQTVSGTKDIVCFSGLFTAFHMTLPITPVYICILILRRKIINRLSFDDVNITKNIKDLQAQLLIAITYQALLPGLYLFSAGTYVIGQLGIYNHLVLEYITLFPISFISVLSPISSLVFVTPYRHFIKKAFCIKEVEKRKSSTNMNVFSQSPSNVA